MYYCIVCSKIHPHRYTCGKVFKKGVYIEPGTGARIPFGMCDRCDGEDGGGQDSMIQTINKDDSSLANVKKWLPIYDYFAESHRRVL
ncbi:DUF3973 domain-containing protein [Cohnella nanjingensis]